MQKPTPEAMAAFEDAFPTDAGAVRKKMFGMPAGFVNGNMFFGVFHDGLTARVGADRMAELIEQPGMGQFEPMKGRPWKDYIHANADLDPQVLSELAHEALAHTAKMPAKVPKPRKKKKS